VRIAIDTNLLIAALVRPSGASARITQAWDRGEIEVVASAATLREAEAVLGGRWLGRLASSERVEALLAGLRARSVWADSPRPITDLPLKDPGDLRLVEAAVAAGASHIVTTDREFLSKRGYGGVEFMTPSEFAAMLVAGVAQSRGAGDRRRRSVR